MRLAKYLTLTAAILVAVSCKDGSTPLSAPKIGAGNLPRPSFSLTPAASSTPAVSAGGWHTCVVKTDGTIACWGNNADGETAIPAGLPAVAQLAAGFYHNCVAERTGAVACWGDDSYGESTPPASLNSVVQVSTGLFHTCALNIDGSVVCWGRDSEGETDVPAGLGTATAISAGGLHSCALLSGGTIACWGDNISFATTIPAGLPPVKQVSTGRSHTCALTTPGAVVCWGDDTSGEIDVPSGLGTVTQISAGKDQHTCALTTAGTVVCWGDNTYGQSTPPAGLSGVVQISSGLNFTCALKGSGTVRCWGNNSNGQITIPAGLTLVVQVAQSISFVSTIPTPALAGATYTLAATATSGLAITYQSLTPTVCTVSGNIVTFVGGGACTVSANQPGNALFLAAVQQQVIAVTSTMQSQTITWKSAPPTSASVDDIMLLQTIGGASGNAVTIASLTKSTCSTHGNLVVFTGIGTCTIAANQAGNADYSAAAQLTANITVGWHFFGFFDPVDNAPSVNTQKAGQTIPVKFSLGINRGTNIFANGSPTSVEASCTTWAPSGTPVATVSKDNHDHESADYDDFVLMYTYTWKTDKSWSGTCRLFSMTLTDGSVHTARFQFKK